MSRFTALVGCTTPLQLAPMSRIVTPALAAAVTGAGGLGMLAPGRSGPADTARAIDAVKALTDGPVGAGFIAFMADRDTVALCAERLGVLDFFWGAPDPALVLPGAVTGWQVGSVEEARAARDAGCGYVVVQGVEAGGHVRGGQPLAELLPAVRAALDLPIVAAGGIGTADDVRRALALGADAVRVGTRFVAAQESDAHDAYVAALTAAQAGDTVLTQAFDVGWPDAPVRVLAASLEAARSAPDGEPVATIPGPDGARVALPRFTTTAPVRGAQGLLAALPHYAGTGVGAVRGRVPATDLVAELTAEGTAP